MAPPEQILPWIANAPTAWPHPPAEMTVTTLLEIEACPRRWALGAAEYPSLWTGRGYPPHVQLGTLAGTVVHMAIEAITKGLVKAGCPSVQDQMAFQVMRELGGYTKVVNECIDRMLDRLASSPRANRILEFAARSLRALVPDLRTRTQTMLCSLRLPRYALPKTKGKASNQRAPLTLGVFPEIEFRVKQIGWKGKVDLLVLSPDTCEITDFKTGVANEKHHFQIQVYALLWSRDVDLNPDGRCADRLVLRYSNGDVDVPTPTARDLSALESEIVARCEAAHRAVSRHPPKARTNSENCLNCYVRHMCNDYWTDETQRLMANDHRTRRFADIEVTINGRHGPSSWNALVECSSIAKSRQPILLRTDNLTFAFNAGKRVRLLSVHLSLPDEQAFESAQNAIIVTMGKTSEAFIILR